MPMQEAWSEGGGVGDGYWVSKTDTKLGGFLPPRTSLRITRDQVMLPTSDSHTGQGWQGPALITPRDQGERGEDGL